MKWQLILYGTAENPLHLHKPDTYPGDYVNYVDEGEVMKGDSGEHEYLWIDVEKVGYCY